MTQQNFFIRRRRNLFLSILGCAILIFAASKLTRFSFIEGLLSFPSAVKWMSSNFALNGEAFARLGDILTKLGQTVLISIMSTVVAAVIAFVFAILGCRTMRPSPFFALLVRAIASFFRNVPVVAWAMIFLFSFGQSDFTGFLALFVETFGFLTRAFLEAIDETAGDSVQALRASGATWWHTVAQSVLPSVMPQLVSWMLYMVETNIRSATLVGILTGTGIGFIFDIFYKRMNYPAAGLTILTIVIVVLIIEMVSNRIRRVIL
jgi:phosphonate transport system permease protein